MIRSNTDEQNARAEKRQASMVHLEKARAELEAAIVDHRERDAEERRARTRKMRAEECFKTATDSFVALLNEEAEALRSGKVGGR
jgi:uncharacterized protein (DUF1015 family)